MSKPTVSSSRK